MCAVLLFLLYLVRTTGMMITIIKDIKYGSLKQRISAGILQYLCESEV